MKYSMKHIVALILLSLTLAWQPAAQADVIDDFAWILDQLDNTNANPFPVSGSDIKASRGLFTCLEHAPNDVAVVGCVDSFKNTPLGQQANSSAGIPSWFWDLVDAYVALRSNDYWGLVAKLGKAAICIIAQVMTSGAVDVCGLIEELVALANDLLDTGKAIAQFIASIGEAAWDTIKSVGCSLGFGGCGSSSPPEQIAYAWVFAPHINGGLLARKKVDGNAFNALLTQLQGNAKHNPVIWSIPSLQSALPNYPPFSSGVVDTASNIYVDVVNAQWTADMGQTVLPALAAKRGQYDSASQIAVAAYDATSKYKSNKTAPGTRVITRCKENFSVNFGFAHVDRWIALFPDKAKALGDVKSNYQWCQSNFWGMNKSKFAPHFKQFAKVNYCPQQGASLVCPSFAKLEACIGLMKSVGQETQCGSGVLVAQEAAKKIDAYFKSKGSKIPCSTMVNNGANPPVIYQCSRPAQKYHCDQAYTLYFSQIPGTLLSCKVQQDPIYGALVIKAKQAAWQINTKYGLQLVSNPVDPLTFLNAPSPSQLSDDIKQDLEKSHGFGPPSLHAGFVFRISAGDPSKPTIDGESSPSVVYDASGILNKINQPVQKAIVIDPRKPGPDPFTDRLKNNRLNTMPTPRQAPNLRQTTPTAPTTRQVAPVQNDGKSVRKLKGASELQQNPQQLAPAPQMTAPAR